LAGVEAPPGWELPPEWVKMLASVPDGPVADVIEEEIARACNYAPTDVALLAEDNRLKSAPRNGTQSKNNGKPTEDFR
jgi:hypothetical protein